MVATMILSVVLAGVLCVVVHEGAHWLTAKLFGKTIKFEFAMGEIFGIAIVPRWTWKHPDLPRNKLAIVCYAGFVTEFVVAALLALIFKWYYMLVIAVIHFIAYQLYAGDASDFKF